MLSIRNKCILSIFILFISLLSIGAVSESNVWVFFSPNPNTEKAVIKFIDGTRSELRIAAYSLTNKNIAQSLKTAKAKGITLRIICDKAQSQIRNAQCTQLGGKVDKRSGLMHNKFIVRDDDGLLTGSFNFTNNAVYNNRENFLIIKSKTLAKVYAEEFDKLYKNNT